MRIHRQLAWAWLIIIGGLMIYPRGVECIVCGRPLTTILGVVSVLLGVIGFFGQSQKSAGA